MQDSFAHSVKEWIDKADNDLGFAAASFKDFDEFYSQMCLLCHDAVEKYLKGYLIGKKRQLIRTHDLMALLKECESIDKEFSSFADNCRKLNLYYTPIKYPSHFPPLAKEDAKISIKTAEKIKKFIKEKIK